MSAVRDPAAPPGPSTRSARPRRRRPLAPALTLALLLGPVAAGLLGTLAPAFGYMPALGGTRPGLGPISDLLAWPGLVRSAALSLGTGLAATGLSLAVVTLVVAGWGESRGFAALRRVLAPLLALPHAAAAFGIAFLIAPSGWIARALSPWATGLETPPDLLIVQDPLGLSLVLGLVAKEVPFLLLMTLAALAQARPGPALAVARALGYRPVTGWIKAVFPAVYAQIRLPVYAVLAYSMTTVDVALILGPNTPPPLSVQVLRWMNDPDLALRFRAAAGASLQLLLVLAALGLWRGLEALAARAGRGAILRGGRGAALSEGALRTAGAGLGTIAALLLLLGLAGLALWSMAGLWPFPKAAPETLTLRAWERYGPRLVEPAARTLLLAATATLGALVLAIACLQAEHRQATGPGEGRARAPGHGSRATALLYVPLLVPQVAFLGGLQTLALAAGLDGGWGSVALVHLVFVLPYVFLALAGPWRAWDARHATIAQALGAGPARVLWRVRLPMLLGPVLGAAAIGFAVSVGQYLPTLLVGAGRVSTLTTEAVALAAGGDRRAIAVYALAQTLAALLPFGLALALPRILWRDRAGLRHG